MTDQLVQDRVAAVGFLGEWLRASIHIEPSDHDRAFAWLRQAVAVWPGPGIQTEPESGPLLAKVAASPPAHPADSGAWRGWLTSVGLAPDLTYLACSLLGEDRQPSERTAGFYLIEREAATFWNGWFHVAFVKSERGRLLPDPARMLGVAVESTFLTAVEQARERAVEEGLLDAALDVLWWIRFDGYDMAPRLTDSSAGVAAGIAMAERSGAVPPRNWVFSGSVNAFAGDDTASPQELDQKYREFEFALHPGLFVVPLADLSRLQSEVPARRPGIRGVGTLRQVLELASNPTARSTLLLPFGDPRFRFMSPWNIERLRWAAQRAVVGAGGAAALVIGDAGMGKGALLHELSEELEADGWLLAQHRCVPHRFGRRVFAPFRDLLRQLRGELTGQRDAVHAERLAALLSDLEAPDAGSAEVDRFRVRRGSIGRRLFQRITDMLSELTETRPVALLLDDLHWTDETSASLFVHLARRVVAGGHQLLLVGSIRPKEGEGSLRGSQLQNLRNEFTRDYADRFWDVDMGALPPTAEEWVVRTVLKAAGCRNPDPVLVALLRERAAANIFNLQLTANWLHGARKLLTEREDWALVAVQASDVPENDRIIDWLVSRSGPEAKEVLRCAAVIGYEFDLDMLARAMGREESDLATWLGQSELVWPLENEDKSQHDYRFVHPRVVGWLRENLNDGTRRLLHSRVAAAYESLLEEEAGRPPGTHAKRLTYEDVSYQLAFHWEQAEQQDLAAPHWAHQAVLNRQLGAYHTALRDRDHELACRDQHTPADSGEWKHWRLCVAKARIDRAGIYRSRGQKGDLDRVDQELAKAWDVLWEVLGSKGSVAADRVVATLGGLGVEWLLTAAKADVESGEAARLRGRFDRAQARLEEAMHWGEWLLASAGDHDAALRRRASRVLAYGGVSLMGLYMGRAFLYLRYEPQNEDARRAQEARVMYLGTRLWALSHHLDPRDHQRDGSSQPPEAAELRVRILNTRGNVFFRLEGHARLALAYYRRAQEELEQRPAGKASAVDAPVGNADRDVHNSLAALRLSLRDLVGARREVEQYRGWAQRVGARAHQSTADYIDALIHVIAATSAGGYSVTGNLGQAAKLLEAALEVTFPSYPELRMRALLLGRWVAELRYPHDDPTRFDSELEEAVKEIWGRVPADLAAYPQAHLFHDVLPDAPWWVREQLEARGVPQSSPLLRAAREREARLVATAGLPQDPVDLADELKARTRARVSWASFLDIQAVERRVARLCAAHVPEDTTIRVLRCAVWVHDCLRELADPELELLAREWKIAAGALDHAHPSWLRGLLGVTLIERELAKRFDEEEERFRDKLREVVVHHSWPSPNMTPAAMLFFVACQLVALEAAVRRGKLALYQLRGNSRDLQGQRAFLERELKRSKETLTEVKRLAEEPATLEQALLVALRWMVHAKRGRGEAIHPRTLELLEGRS